MSIDDGALKNAAVAHIEDNSTQAFQASHEATSISRCFHGLNDHIDGLAGHGKCSATFHIAPYQKSSPSNFHRSLISNQVTGIPLEGRGIGIIKFPYPTVRHEAETTMPVARRGQGFSIVAISEVVSFSSFGSWVRLRLTGTEPEHAQHVVPRYDAKCFGDGGAR
jgi:hypothetical protein